MAKTKSLKLILIIGGLTLIFLPSAVKIHKLESKNKSLQDQVIQLQRSNAQFSAEAKRLKQDTDYVEKIARQKMGLTKQGEVIYKIKEEGETKSKNE